MAKTRQFGATWWGKAWLDALEQRALVDPNRLPRGRTYARQDRVREVELAPGEVRARVWGNRTEPYSTTLSIRQLDATEWDQLLDQIMHKAANVAALLAGELPADLGDRILPDRGDLGPECSCPDWAEPCKHAAALCYVAADLFDVDPFGLLTLRGRGREQVLAEVRSRRSATLGIDPAPLSDLPRGPDPGISAAAAYRRKHTEVQRSPTLGPAPGTMTPLAVPPPADAGIDLGELAALVNDGARRAWAMLAQGAASELQLSVGADVVRRAADPDADIEAIADATALDPQLLTSAVLGWRHGGFDGYRAVTAQPDVHADQLAPGQQALGAQAKIRANTVSLGAVQLRLDERGQWWQFALDHELGWVIAGGPADHPAELVEGLPSTS